MRSVEDHGGHFGGKWTLTIYLEYQVDTPQVDRLLGIVALAVVSVSPLPELGED